MISRRTTNWLILLYVSTLLCTALGLPQNSYNNQQQQQQQPHQNHQFNQNNNNHNHHHYSAGNHYQNHEGQNYNNFPTQALHSGSTNSPSQFPAAPPPLPPSSAALQVPQQQLQPVQFSQKLQQPSFQMQAQKIQQQQAYLQNQQNQYFQQQQQQQQQNKRNQAPITSYNNEISPDGSFAYGYTTGDGQQAQAQGFVKNLGNKDLEAQVVQGSYSYTSPDGKPISVKYLADENGFRAEGLHLPTPPPIPDAIARALQYIARVQATNPQLYLQNQQQFNQQQQPTNQFSGNYNKLG